MKGKKADLQRLYHIRDSIQEIQNYTLNQTLESFLENSMMKFASIKQIEIIGEAANLISIETKSKFIDIEWRQIIGMRQILVHEYFGIDSHLIWQIIFDDIPKLKQAIESAIRSMIDS